MYIALLIICVAFSVYLIFKESYLYLTISIPLLIHSLHKIVKIERATATKLAIMFDAIDNNDYTLNFINKYNTDGEEILIESLNRVIKLLSKAKEKTIQKEKYYELILKSVNTGIAVVGKNGAIYQYNQKLLNLLNLNDFTNVKQLSQLYPELKNLILTKSDTQNESISISNEKDTLHLSIRMSTIEINSKNYQIFTFNDINKELDINEVESWIKLTKVLTHEIMNSIAPITSICDSLIENQSNEEDVKNGLATISTTGKGLMQFVKSYRSFTNIPIPVPTIFHVDQFIDRQMKLAIAERESLLKDVDIQISITPKDLIIYADENLTGQVVSNLLKNAVQALESDTRTSTDKRYVRINAYSAENEDVIIEIIDNGEPIPKEIVEDIFTPFFTTKQDGSGVGLSISKQIMQASNGTLNFIYREKEKVFRLTFI